jgi:hypothetical protein
MRLKSFLFLVLLLSVFCTVTDGQSRDPFAKPAWAKPKTNVSGGGSKASPETSPSRIPSIEARINYYKRLREAAILDNKPIPKVTTVLALDELAVTGIFKTPRGYAAIVEAKPLKLSYTIYPGDRFFDGQLVAIEENKLIFRKVTKLSSGKFSVSEETKPLKQYTVQQELSGTAPTETTSRKEAAEKEIPINQGQEATSQQESVVPIFEEMLRQQGLSSEKPKEKSVQKKFSSEENSEKQQKSGESRPTKSKKKP